ncbi:hypothetical protein BD560DRAFT_436291 [Blakeslea trispora]|nr:hypothetical protein BD560DRAFT_436291 [Blakeslea trispora]
MNSSTVAAVTPTIGGQDLVGMTPMVIDTIDTSGAKIIQLNDTIDELCKRRQTLADKLTQAVLETSGAVAEEAQMTMDKITLQIDALRKVLFNLTSSDREKEKATKINFSDLPLFQLKSQETYWPNHMKYASVEHFLKTFVKVIVASGNNIEDVWCRYICLTLPYDYDSWLETDLKQGKTWKDAQKLFVSRFGNLKAQDDAIRRLYNCFMRRDETIIAYTARFIKTMHEAGRDQTDTTLANKHDADYIWTVEEIATVAKKVFGSYPNDEHVFPAEKKKTHRDFAAAGSRFFCPKHGGDKANHHARDCYSSRRPTHHTFLGDKNVPRRAADTNVKTTPCFYCKKPYNYVHTCNEYRQAKAKQNKNQTRNVLSMIASNDHSCKEQDEDEVMMNAAAAEELAVEQAIQDC